MMMMNRQTYSDVWAQSRKSFVERWFDCKMAEESVVLQSFCVMGYIGWKAIQEKEI